MNSLRKVVPGETWRDFLSVVYGVWMVVWIYATLHDQYLIRIAPEHFTLYHYRIPFTQDYTLLAILYALGASISPGLALGVALYVVGRLGSRPKLTTKTIIVSVIWTCVVVEICGLATGLVAWRTNRGLFPAWVYPDQTRGILTTQTIQITAYLVGLFLSATLILWTWLRRRN